VCQHVTTEPRSRTPDDGDSAPSWCTASTAANLGLTEDGRYGRRPVRYPDLKPVRIQHPPWDTRCPAGGTLSLLGLFEPAAGRPKHRHQQEQKRHDRKRRARDQHQRRQHAANAAATKRHKATVEDPCGNGKGPDNACGQDTDNCTRYCQKSIGRCRCKQLGQGCTEDRNCCANLGQPMSCQNRTCQMLAQDPVPVATTTT
jgi:hypothetical protein